MNSKGAQKLYSGYLEGELSADEEDELRSYLAGSPEAAADYRAFEATVDILRSLPREEAADEMTREIMSRVRRARARGEGVLVGRERKRLELIPLAAMLVLGFVFAFAAINAGGGFGGAGDMADDATFNESATAFASGGEVLVPEGHALSETFDQNRYDRPLRQVDSGSESPSIVF